MKCIPGKSNFRLSFFSKYVESFKIFQQSLTKLTFNCFCSSAKKENIIKFGRENYEFLNAQQLKGIKVQIYFQSIAYNSLKKM